MMGIKKKKTMVGSGGDRCGRKIFQSTIREERIESRTPGEGLGGGQRGKKGLKKGKNIVVKEGLHKRSRQDSRKNVEKEVWEKRVFGFPRITEERSSSI